VKHVLHGIRGGRDRRRSRITVQRDIEHWLGLQQQKTVEEKNGKNVLPDVLVSWRSKVRGKAVYLLYRK